MANQNLLSSQPQQTPQQPVIQPITPTSIPAGIIQPRHLQANYFLVKAGLAANRPKDGTSTKFYFATDTFILSYYDPSSKAWKSGSTFT